MSHRKSTPNRFTTNNKKSNMKKQEAKPITVLVYEPPTIMGAGAMVMMPAEVQTKGELEEYQRLVGGFIQMVKWGEYTLYVDEDGQNKQLKPSLFGGLVGNIVVSKFKNRKEVGLSAQDIELLLKPIYAGMFG